MGESIQRNCSDTSYIGSRRRRDHTASAMASAVDSYFSTHLVGTRTGAN